MISFLFSSGAIKETKQIQSQDLKVGIPNLLICIEMAIFATLHLWAFSWKPYANAGTDADLDPSYYGPKITYQGGPLGLKALSQALNPWDLLKAVGRSFR